jgi:hypothetical protein
MTGIIQYGKGGLIMGLVFCAAGIILSRLQKGKDFLRQLGLAISLAGQVLFVMGLSDWLYNLDIHYSQHTIWITLSLIALEVILIALNKDPIQRFLSLLIIVSALLVLILDRELTPGFHLLVAMMAISAVILLQHEYNHFALTQVNLWQPVAYGAVVTLLGLLLLPLEPYSEFENLWVSAILLLLVLLFLEWQILRELTISTFRETWFWILLVCTVVLIIPAVRMPGILGALIVLLLGFWRSKRSLLGLAALFLIFYLGAFYYYLEWSLLVKSLALMGTGIAMFITRSLFRSFSPEVPS